VTRLTPGRIVQLAVSLGVAGLFVWLAVRTINGPELVSAMAAARPGWVMLGVAAFLSGYCCRIARWRVMLVRDNPGLGWLPISAALYGSIAANNVLPFRAGDALRVFGFSRYLGVPVSTLLATLVVERLLDLLSLLMAFGLALLFLPLTGGAAGTLIGIGGSGLIAIGLVVMAVLLFPQMFEPIAHTCLRILARIAPGIGGKLGEFSERTFATLRHLAHGPRMLILVLWSACAWGFEGAVFWSVAHAIPAMTVPSAGWLSFPVGTLATLLPSTPGYVGTFDFFAIKAAQAMGNSAAASAAFALLVHLVIWLPATIIGGIALLVWNSARQPSGLPQTRERAPS